MASDGYLRASGWSPFRLPGERKRVAKAMSHAEEVFGRLAAIEPGAEAPPVPSGPPASVSAPPPAPGVSSTQRPVAPPSIRRDPRSGGVERTGFQPRPDTRAHQSPPARRRHEMPSRQPEISRSGPPVSRRSMFDWWSSPPVTGHVVDPSDVQQGRHGEPRRRRDQPNIAEPSDSAFRSFESGGDLPRRRPGDFLVFGGEVWEQADDIAAYPLWLPTETPTETHQEG
jgi:hypothetical protein